MGDQHPDREARPDGDGGLHIQRTPDDLLADLADTLGCPEAEALEQQVPVVAGTRLRPTLSKVERTAALNSVPQ